MGLPTLEALTASYNSAATLPQTLTSAWDDNRIPVLLVDDGSTDGSAEDAERHEGVRVLRQRNAGPSVARNRAIMESRADFVLFLDSDDLLLPGYREAFEAAVAANSEADVFICGMQRIDDHGHPLDRRAAPSLQPTPFLSLLSAETVPTNGIIVRRELFARSGLFRPGLHHAEDWDLWLRLAAASDRWVRMDHTLAVYRQRGGSLSKNGRAMWRGIRQVANAAARLPIGEPGARRVAAKRALADGASYVYYNAFAQPLRERARVSVVGVLRDLAHMPLRFWPILLGDVARSALRQSRNH
ncbi:glycosyltransferase [Variovorax sp. Sphag1AA]|uniref:glycosyltransferase n=1 Tax=Variovorax sp. Sphag1AA TaxID=2587027 RepID=UPI00160F5F14|nr:glycosyltransferase [Variovorax sp. Sphag1AA]MBB3177134.1 glycosyltransferase involved in cell wall biosynthesis [Variovorax sp. Sphag1AA]